MGESHWARPTKLAMDHARVPLPAPIRGWTEIRLNGSTSVIAASGIGYTRGDPRTELRHARIHSIFSRQGAPFTPTRDPGEPHVLPARIGYQRAAAVALTGIGPARRFSCADHVFRDLSVVAERIVTGLARHKGNRDFTQGPDNVAP